MKNKFKKFLIILLAFCIVFQGIGTAVFAESTEESPDEIEDEFIQEVPDEIPDEIPDETEDEFEDEFMDEFIDDFEDELLEEIEDGLTEEDINLDDVVGEDFFEQKAEEDSSAQNDFFKTAEYTQAESEKIQFLTALGIIKTLPSADEQITRAEYASYLYRLLNMPSSAGKNVTFFYDVDTKNPYLESINAVYSTGIMNGVYDKYFAPEEVISCQNATVALIRMLGYEYVALQNGGYPDGYNYVAAKIRLYADSGSYDGTLTGKALVNLLYRALFTNVLEMENVNTQGTITYTESSADLLENNFSYLKYKGTVVADGFATIGGRKTCDNNRIVIKNGTKDYVYTLKNEGSDLFVGRDVEYYANSEGEIIYLNALVNNSEVIIDAYDIESVDPYIRSITYSDGGRNKTAKIEGVADFIYNGVNDIMVAADIENCNGTVRLLDSDSDGKYECVFVTNYQYFLTDSITNEGVLRDKRMELSFDFNEDDDKCRTTILKYGISIPSSMIEENQTVTVIASRNTVGMKKILAYVSDELKEGTVTAISDTKIEINGVDYECNKDVEIDSLYIRDNILYLLDTNKRVCLYEKIYADSEMYLYVTGYGEKSSVSNGCSIRALNDSGDFVVYDFAKNYRVNDSKGSRADVFANLTLGGETVVPQLVAAELDEEGKIKKIQFDSTAEGPKPEGSKNAFTYNASFTTERLDISRQTVAAQYWIDTNTRIFTLITDASGEIIESATMDAIKNFKSLKSRQIMPIEVYDAAETDRVAGALVVKIPVTKFTSLYSREAYAFIVESMIYKRNADDDMVPTAVGYLNGSKITLMGEPDIYDISGWKPGEAYRVIIGSTGSSVLNAQRVFALEEDPDDTYSFYYDKVYDSSAPAISSEKLASDTVLTLGKLRNISNDGINAAYIEVEGSEKVYTFSFSSQARLYRYDLEYNECIPIQVRDLVPGEGKIFIISAYGRILDLIVFR